MDMSLEKEMDYIRSIINLLPNKRGERQRPGGMMQD